MATGLESGADPTFATELENELPFNDDTDFHLGLPPIIKPI